MPNITNITPPRVELIDARTGYVSREWYRFFYNLFYATGGTNAGAIPTDRGGTGTTQVPTDGQILVGNGATGNYNATDLGVNPGITKTVGAGTLSLDLALTSGDGIDITPGLTDLTITNTGVLSNIAGQGIAVDQATGDVTIENTGVLSIIAGRGIEVDQATGDVTISTTYGTFATKTANFALADEETYIINNKSGSACTVTLPAAADWAGRPVFFQNYQAQQLLSASSNIIPQGGGTATNVILGATDGAWAMIVSNGTNWAIMEASYISSADQESQTATSGQTVFNLTTMTYVPGSNTLSVFVDGVNQILGDAYTETNSTRVTFTAGLHVGAKVRFATS